MYSETDATRGTLKNLRNLLSRSAVGKEPSKNVHAVEDFLDVVLSSYILRATLLELDINVEEGLKDKRQNKMDVNALAETVVDRITCLSGQSSNDCVLQHTKVTTINE